jgi:hypothetical protein
MIAAETFAQGIALLAERFRHEPSPAMCAVYYEQLSAELDDPHFVAAVKLVIRARDTAYAYYPSIQDLIDAGRPPGVRPESEAGAIFTAIQANPLYSPERGSFYHAGTVEERHGIAAAKAFNAIGGAARFNTLRTSDLPFALKEFCAAYAEQVETARAIGQLESLGAKALPRSDDPDERRKLAVYARNVRKIEQANAARERLGMEPLALPKGEKDPTGPQTIGEILNAAMKRGAA